MRASRMRRCCSRRRAPAGRSRTLQSVDGRRLGSGGRCGRGRSGRVADRLVGVARLRHRRRGGVPARGAAVPRWLRLRDEHAVVRPAAGGRRARSDRRPGPQHVPPSVAAGGAGTRRHRPDVRRHLPGAARARRARRAAAGADRPSRGAHPRPDRRGPVRPGRPGPAGGQLAVRREGVRRPADGAHAGALAGFVRDLEGEESTQRTAARPVVPFAARLRPRRRPPAHLLEEDRRGRWRCWSASSWRPGAPWSCSRCPRIWRTTAPTTRRTSSSWRSASPRRSPPTWCGPAAR